MKQKVQDLQLSGSVQDSWTSKGARCHVGHKMSTYDVYRETHAGRNQLCTRQARGWCNIDA